MTVGIKRLLIEAVKPRETSTIELTQSLCSLEGVDECEIITTDVDVRTETFRLTVKGSNIDYDELKKTMDKSGLAVKGIDEIHVVKTRKIQPT